MSQQAPVPPPPTAVPVALPANSSVWDRISNWVSENKAVVYTIAGVTVVVVAGAGVFYYTKDGSVRRPLLAGRELCKASPSEGSMKLTDLPGHVQSRQQVHSPNSAKRRGGSARKPRRKPRQSEVPHRKRHNQHPRPPVSTAPTRSQSSPKPPLGLCRQMSVNNGLSS